MDKQSMRISVDRFYYAKLINDSGSGTTYQTAVHLPGITAVAIRSESEIGAFYTADGVYETYYVEGGNDLQVSFAGLSNAIIGELTGASYGAGLLVDKKGDSPPYVAVGFRTQKSNGHYRYFWIYKGRFAKADLNGYSKSNTLSPQPDIYIFKAVSRMCDGAWRQTLDSDDPNVPGEALADLDSEWFGNPNYAP